MQMDQRNLCQLKSWVPVFFFRCLTDGDNRGRRIGKQLSAGDQPRSVRRPRLSCAHEFSKPARTSADNHSTYTGLRHSDGRQPRDTGRQPAHIHPLSPVSSSGLLVAWLSTRFCVSTGVVLVCQLDARPRVCCHLCVQPVQVNVTSYVVLCVCLWLVPCVSFSFENRTRLSILSLILRWYCISIAVEIEPRSYTVPTSLMCSPCM